MKTAILKGISYIGLVLTVVPSLLVFAGDVTLAGNKVAMIVGMVMWFGTAPMWLKK